MIPREFEYHAPVSLPDALGLLAKLGDEAKLLAGGHSLLPMMKMRFAAPAHLVDLGRIAELKGIREDKGAIVIGAMTTENELIWSKLLQEKCPLLVEGARAHLRSAGALPGHDRRRHRARRSGQRSSGADAGARRLLRAAARGGRARRARRRLLRRDLRHGARSPARSSPRSGFPFLRRAPAGATPSSSARSAISRPPRRR